MTDIIKNSDHSNVGQLNNMGQKHKIMGHSKNELTQVITQKPTLLRMTHNYTSDPS